MSIVKTVRDLPQEVRDFDDDFEILGYVDSFSGESIIHKNEVI